MLSPVRHLSCTDSYSGNSGIGAEAARVFAKMGANVYIACRDTEKAKTVQESIQETTNNPNVHVLPLDLGRIESKSLV